MISMGSRARRLAFFYIVRVGKFLFFPRFCFYSLNYTRAGRRSAAREYDLHVMCTVYIYIYYHRYRYNADHRPDYLFRPRFVRYYRISIYACV